MFEELPLMRADINANELVEKSFTRKLRERGSEDGSALLLIMERNNRSSSLFEKNNPSLMVLSAANAI
jgi:hypothetical protein